MKPKTNTTHRKPQPIAEVAISDQFLEGHFQPHRKGRMRLRIILKYNNSNQSNFLKGDILDVFSSVQVSESIFINSGDIETVKKTRRE